MIRPRVLLADDHPAYVATVRELLAQDCDVVGSVEDGMQLLEAAVRSQPDVIVLDLHMPKMNGLDACRQLTRIIPRTRVVVLTADADEDVRQITLAAGAFAFIGKHAAGKELLPAVIAACSEATPLTRLIQTAQTPIEFPIAGIGTLTLSFVPH